MLVIKLRKKIHKVWVICMWIIEIHNHELENFELKYNVEILWVNSLYEYKQ